MSSPHSGVDEQPSSGTDDFATTESTAPLPATASRTWRPLPLRLHFYAGVMVGPFILIAAITGSLYALAPTIEKFLYDDVFTVEAAGTSPMPLSQQVAAAQAAYPDLTVTAVLPAASSDASTRVHMVDPGLGPEELRAVFVDPGTGAVLGSETSWMGSLPFSTWVDVLHRDLHLGALGNLYSELAASWLWIVALGGLLLWCAKFRTDRARRRPSRLLRVNRSAQGRMRTLNWHGATGTWILPMLLFLSATGITWAPYAGEHVTELRAAMSWQRPALQTALDESGDVPAGTHSGHDGSHAGSAAPTDVDLDQAVAAAERVGVQAPVEIAIPSEPGQAIVVSESAKPYRLTTDAAAIDPATMEVHSALDYDHAYPLMAKLADWGIRMHMGTLFGLLNQLLLLAVALVLVTVIVRGYRMWWQRRPTRAAAWAVGRLPARGGLRRAPRLGTVVLAVAVVGVGWFLPLLGISVLIFVAIDLILAAIARRSARA